MRRTLLSLLIAPLCACHIVAALDGVDEVPANGAGGNSGAGASSAGGNNGAGAGGVGAGGNGTGGNGTGGDSVGGSGGGGNPIVALTAGAIHSCALFADGTVKCWGDNSEQQLGDGTTISDGTAVATQISGASTISSSFQQTCAALSDNTVSCWGCNQGNLLLSNNGQPSQPPLPALGLDGVSQVDVSNNHICVLKTDGSVQCWGNNAVGELGIGSNVPSYSNTPVTAVGPNNLVTLVSGISHTCGYDASGYMQCWGYNERGQLGRTSTGNHDPSPAISLIPANIIAMAAAYQQTFALVEGGTLYSWGDNDNSQLGRVTSGIDPFDSTPELVLGNLDVLAVTASNGHTCATLYAGTVKCWGYNGDGQLGTGTNVPSSLSPLDVVNLSNVKLIAAGNAHTCAVRDDDTVYCWGHNAFRQLGDGTTTSSNVPVQVLGL